MRGPILAALLLALAPGYAGAQELAALFSGKEVYRNQGWGSETVRHDRWRFAPDGTFAGDTAIDYATWAGTGFVRYLRTSGRWRVAGDRLCLAEDSRYGQRPETCYALERVGESDLQVELRGVEVGEGRRWQFFVYK